jgi:hypothetical protein
MRQGAPGPTTGGADQGDGGHDAAGDQQAMPGSTQDRNGVSATQGGRESSGWTRIIITAPP